MILRKKAFTLIEMLVVIAIIAILAAALFPAIQGAIDSAKATGMKNKGRGIWVAVVSANSEREPLSLQSLWPTNVVAITGKAQDYFNYLLSKGDSNYCATVQNRVCGDLAPTSLTGAGVPAGAYVDGQAVPSLNMAWHVALLSDNSASEDAFMITKNLKLLGGTGTKLDDSAAVTSMGVPAQFDAVNVNPFGSSHGVWVTRGGGTFDARPRYLTVDRINGPETNVVLHCDSGSTAGT